MKIQIEISESMYASLFQYSAIAEMSVVDLIVKLLQFPLTNFDAGIVRGLNRAIEIQRDQKPKI